MSFTTINLKTIGDERGSLIALENNAEIPFEVKRVYYIFGTQKGVERGFHAHKVLRQMAICVSGSCTIRMEDASDKGEVVLATPEQALMIEPMQWHEMYNFSPDCVLMVLANDVYDESDYIRNYEAYKRLIGHE